MEAVAPIGQPKKVVASTLWTVPARGERHDSSFVRVCAVPGMQDDQSLVGVARFKDLLRQQSLTTDTRLIFRMDEDSGKLVAEIRDYATGELVRQIPPEEMIRISKAISEYLGLLVDERR